MLKYTTVNSDNKMYDTHNIVIFTVMSIANATVKNTGSCNPIVLNKNQRKVNIYLF